MKKYNLDEMYAKYEKWYANQEMKLLKKGREMFSPKYTKGQFRNVYYETKAELTMLKEGGNRGSVGNVYQYMVREQAYPISQGMEKGLKELYKEAGAEVNFTRFDTYEKIRKNTPDKVWDLAQEKYDNYIAIGLTGKKAAEEIAKMFFGSI